MGRQGDDEVRRELCCSRAVELGEEMPMVNQWLDGDDGLRVHFR